MCKINQLSLISTIMSFLTILTFIKTLPNDDRSREMVSFIGNNKKLARTLGQINFLIDCRSLKIMPSFILNRTEHVSKNHPNYPASQID